MSFSLLFTTEAKLDVQDAWLWYEKQRAGLGDEFILSLEATLSEIERTPLIYQIQFKDIRIALLKRFPYKAVFTVEKEQIIIIGVLNSKRDPTVWITRV